jgi:hypothetical protein
MQIAGFIYTDKGKYPLKFSDAAYGGYTVVMAAYSMLNKHKMEFVDDLFLAYTGTNKSTQDYDVIQAISQDVTNAKQMGIKYALACVGGSNNTFEVDMSDYKPEKMAGLINQFCQRYNLDGINFDLFEMPTYYSPKQFNDILKAIKDKNNDLITAVSPFYAPVSPTDERPKMVISAKDNIFSTATRAENIDIAFIKLYRYGDYRLDSRGRVSDEVYQTVNCAAPAFIERAFKAINYEFSEIVSELYVCEPSSKKTAIGDSLYDNGDLDNVYASMRSQFAKLLDKQYFTGVCTYSTSDDYVQGYHFLNHVKDLD